MHKQICQVEKSTGVCGEGGPGGTIPEDQEQPVSKVDSVHELQSCL